MINHLPRWKRVLWWTERLLFLIALLIIDNLGTLSSIHRILNIFSIFMLPQMLHRNPRPFPQDVLATKTPQSFYRPVKLQNSEKAKSYVF